MFNFNIKLFLSILIFLFAYGVIISIYYDIKNCLKPKSKLKGVKK